VFVSTTGAFCRAVKPGLELTPEGIHQYGGG